MNRDALIRARGCGDRVGRNGCLIPGPGHSSRDRSLSVTFDPSHRRGYIFKSFAGDDPQACMDYLDGLLGRSLRPGERPTQQPRPQLVHNAGPDFDAEKRSGRAIEIWDSARSARGTAAEEWLNSRGIDLPVEIDGEVIRFHPLCPWETIRVPAMVALVRNVRTDKPQAIHRTRLDQKDRKMLGPFSGGCIKLDADDAVTHGLTVGEGIETCLAARQMGLRPVWAFGSAGGITSFGPLSGIECLTILGEVGDGGANARASDACARLWAGSGAEVVLLEPLHGGDANDVLRMGAARG